MHYISFCIKNRQQFILLVTIPIYRPQNWAKKSRRTTFRNCICDCDCGCGCGYFPISFTKHFSAYYLFVDIHSNSVVFFSIFTSSLLQISRSQGTIWFSAYKKNRNRNQLGEEKKEQKESNIAIDTTAIGNIFGGWWKSIARKKREKSGRMRFNLIRTATTIERTKRREQKKKRRTAKKCAVWINYYYTKSAAWKIAYFAASQLFSYNFFFSTFTHSLDIFFVRSRQQNNIVFSFGLCSHL